MTSSGSRSPRPGPRRRSNDPPRRRRLQQPSAAARGDLKALRQRAAARRAANPQRLRPGGAKPPRLASQNERYIAIGAVFVLLVVGLFALITIATSDGDEGGERAAAPTTTATAAATPSVSPTQEGGISEASREDRREALATVRAQGYEPVNPRSYKPHNRLRVLVGRAIPGAGTTGERAFFFFGDEFIGTDTEEASAGVEVLDASRDLVITLRYDRFASGNPEPADVRYRYEGGKLRPLDPVPPAAERGAASG